MTAARKVLFFHLAESNRGRNFKKRIAEHEENLLWSEIPEPRSESSLEEFVMVNEVRQEFPIYTVRGMRSK